MQLQHAKAAGQRHAPLWVVLCRYELIDRFVAGLSALFLAVRRRPVIRYQRGSEHAQRLADSLYNLTYKQVGGEAGAASSAALLWSWEGSGPCS